MGERARLGPLGDGVEGVRVRRTRGRSAPTLRTGGGPPSLASSVAPSPLPLRLARAAARTVRDAVARRTAPPVVLAVRAERLTRQSPGALAELHECVVAAEVADRPGVLVVAGDPGGGVAVVVADGRWSAREVQVFGLADAEAATAALTRHGFRPDATRVSLRDGTPEADGEPVAVAFAAAPDADALREVVVPLVARLAVGGVLVVDASGPAALAVVEGAVASRDVRLVRRSHLHAVRRS